MAKKQVSPGVLALRKVVDDVHKDAREAKKRGELVGWSSSKFPCELAAAFDLNVMYPENQAAGIAANRYGEMMCQAAEDLGANKFQTFTKVIWKLSIPGVLNGIMMVFLLSISTFVIPKLLGGGQYMLIGNLIESQFISVGDWNFGSAISLILAVLILIFMSLMKKMDKDE